MEDYEYVGAELDLFAAAVNWKRYYASRLKAYITGDVLEVGAGIGGTSRFLCHSGVTRWTCLEPDPGLADRLRTALATNPLGVPTAVDVGTTSDVSTAEVRFDTILYIDVIEHIEDDAAEVERGFALLKSGGRLVVLSPAHPWLFSPFDAAIGHFRRYTRRTLAKIRPQGQPPERIFYLDSVGLAASLANKLILGQNYPTPSQIKLWDTRMVPLSRFFDRATFGRLGKSVVGIWRNRNRERV